MTIPAPPASLSPTWIEELLLALASATRDDPFLNFQEGHYNLAVANVLLGLGATLQFATTDPEASDFVCLASGWSSNPRLHRLSHGSGDLTLTSPALICLELKCRPDYGPKAQAAFPEIAEDLDRIATEAASAFLFSFDERLYRSFDGSAKKTKKSTTGDLLRGFFPKATSLSVGKVLAERRVWASTQLDTWALKGETSLKKTRLFVFGQASNREVNNRDDR